MQTLFEPLPAWPEEAPQLELDRPENMAPQGQPGPLSGELGGPEPCGHSENRLETHGCLSLPLSLQLKPHGEIYSHYATRQSKKK